MILINKYTYKVKSQIKALGGKWNISKKGWEMPSEKAYNQALLSCLEVELKELEIEENDPENEGGDLDYIQREWMRCDSQIKKLKEYITTYSEEKIK